MSNKCPPGVVCIENITLLFIILILATLFYIVYSVFSRKFFNQINNINQNNDISNSKRENQLINSLNVSRKGIFPRPSFSFSNLENDILLNPYEAPLTNNNFFSNSGRGTHPENRVPINIQTQSYDTNYRQVGILTRHGTSGKETILPLMGRPLITNRNKWNFYAMSESNNMIKLQVSSVNNNGNNNHRNCMGSNGCDDLMNGDLVKVDGYNDLFKVTTYENDTPRYIPYI